MCRPATRAYLLQHQADPYTLTAGCTGCNVHKGIQKAVKKVTLAVSSAAALPFSTVVHHGRGLAGCPRFLPVDPEGYQPLILHRWRQVAAKVAALRLLYGSDPIYVTRHGIGGMFATLVALDLNVSAGRAT